jgi:hypothetical protein
MKTIIDAVKELKGELNGAAGVCYPEDSYLFYALDGSHYIFDECKDTDGVYQYVCTRKEFLATVAECETNFGECDINTVSAYLIALCDGDTTELEPTKDLDKELDVDIDWSKTKYNFALVNSSADMVEFSEFKPVLTDDTECYTIKESVVLYYAGPWVITERHASKPTPIFTQEMADDDSFLPPVDMIVKHKGVKKIVIGELDCNNNLALKSLENELYSLGHIEDIEPLTPTITLDDGKAYQFEYKGTVEVHGIHCESEGTFITRTDVMKASKCTNIQPLTVEKK